MEVRRRLSDLPCLPGGHSHQPLMPALCMTSALWPLCLHWKVHKLLSPLQLAFLACGQGNTAGHLSKKSGREQVSIPRLRFEGTDWDVKCFGYLRPVSGPVTASFHCHLDWVKKCLGQHL